ncbi:MAG: 7-carboxy-7-deazaguanine synthase QueE [Elusimicrobia bacterium]|nr:7-carboxy-7-deazaguanine synthase QueE [Elusimicrobiota bacterium]
MSETQNLRNDSRGWITEIFSSIQGEGLLLAAPMIFIRFGGCNLRCTWCDEPGSLALNSGRPMTVSAILDSISQLSNSPLPSWVSLTGGEPLLQAPFLSQLIPHLKNRGFKLYLETSGVLHESLAQIAGWIDLISMDIKLPSALDPAWRPNYPNGHSQGMGPIWFDRHDQFLSIAPDKTCVKIVVTGKTSLSEFTAALTLVKKYPNAPLFVIQPATATNNDLPPNQNHLETLLGLAWQNLNIPVRLITQHHPIWKLA